MSDLTDAQYAAFIDRLVECREAEDAAKSDTKQVYAELAEAGEDKTAAGLVVRGLRMSAKDRVKANLRDAAVESGFDRYNRGKASHVRVREAEPEHDAETGEVKESTGVSQKRAQTATGLGAGGDNLAPSSRPTATAKTDVPSHQSQASGVGQSQDNSGVRVAPVDTIIEPQAGDGNARPVPVQTGGLISVPAASAGQVAVASPAISSQAIEGLSVPFTRDGSPISSAGTEGEADRQHITDLTKPNPICRDPEDCGVYASWHLPCESCKRAAVERRAA